MTRQRGPGGKNRKKAKASATAGNRELFFAEDGQCYAYVIDSHGGGRYKVLCNDGVTRSAILRGNMWKRVWVRRNDMILVALRDYQDSKADIIHKFTNDEVMRLVGMQEIPVELARHYNAGEYDPSQQETDDTIVFEFEDDDFVNRI